MLSEKDSSIPPASLVQIKVDGRQLKAPVGEILLKVLLSAGIDVPALCHHPDLAPVGACRLCQVEISYEEQRDFRTLAVSCLAPIREGLEVFTSSPRVMAARRETLTTLRALCPSSTVIASLAAKYGLDQSTPQQDAPSYAPENLCLLCGLCSRICENYSVNAITSLTPPLKAHSSNSRPVLKPQFSEHCILCGACAAVCPTGNIDAHWAEGSFFLEKQEEKIAVCEVDFRRCLACGCCEEACPFAVARIKLTHPGEKVAVILAEHCRGCGVCVGACPSGAISQQRYALKMLRKQAAPAV